MFRETSDPHSGPTGWSAPSGDAVLSALLGAVFLVGLAGCRSEADQQGPAAGLSDSQTQILRSLSPLPPVPNDRTNRVSTDDAAAHFGRFLFYDERLSADGEVSCASCHRPNHGFSVPTDKGRGVGETPRHPPSLLNVAHHRWYDWDGKADSLWAQAARPLENASEMGTTRTAVVRTIARHRDLRRAYEAVFESMPEMSDDDRFDPAAKPTPARDNSEAGRAWRGMAEADRRTVNRVFSNVLKAIAAYQTRLVSGDSRFDRWIREVDRPRDERTVRLSDSAIRGAELFVGEAECINCHNGPLFSDRTFHNLGLGSRPWTSASDLGRWRGIERLRRSDFLAGGPYSDAPDGQRAKWTEFLARKPEARGQFKTPTLRNVARTPPYMHGPHFDTLEEVVRFYSRLDGQVRVGHREEMLEPLGLADAEVEALVAFLRTLDGERPAPELMGPPDSPVPPMGDE